MRKKRNIKSIFMAWIMLLLAMGITQNFSHGFLEQPLVVEAATNVKINKTKATLLTGQTLQLKITGTKSKIVWSSSNSKIAGVTKNGKVSAKAKGNVIITAKVNNKKYTCKITVTQKKSTVSKIPTCISYQTVYARGMGSGSTVFNNLTLPSCFIYIKNLDKNAKVTDVRSTNSKIKATKREELDAIEVSYTDYSTNLLGASSTISFKVIQNKKTYKLSCKINVKKNGSPFSVFKVGSKEIASNFVGCDSVSEKFSGTQKIFVKMASGYVLDSIVVYYNRNNNITFKTVKNGTKVNLNDCMWIRANYHTTKKPDNYVPSAKWYGVAVKSPLHDYCLVNVF